VLSGLNHITLAVSDVEKSLNFYVNVLGFKPCAKWKQGAYLTLGNLWLCLSFDEAKPARDYSHIAFDIAQEQFSTFTQSLVAAGVEQWKVNSSEGDSIYFLDPDGHKLEVHVGNLDARLRQLRSHPYQDLIIF